ncbi:MAG: hypothetical protein JNK85_05495 [Verrucomicrobiales bacterium]|nr:hypothetical protein [Verrucomicrobiales bacterium]
MEKPHENHGDHTSIPGIGRQLDDRERDLFELLDGFNGTLASAVAMLLMPFRNNAGITEGKAPPASGSVPEDLVVVMALDNASLAERVWDSWCATETFDPKARLVHLLKDGPESVFTRACMSLCAELVKTGEFVGGRIEENHLPAGLVEQARLQTVKIYHTAANTLLRGLRQLQAAFVIATHHPIPGDAPSLASN